LIGLQSPLLSGLPAPSSLAGLAAEHADRIASVYPAGPVRLLGWSFGGALALCLAAELRSRGRTVAFVGMLDTRRPPADPGASSEVAPGLAGAASGLGSAGAAASRSAASGSANAGSAVSGSAVSGSAGDDVASLLAELGFEVPAGTSTVAEAVALIRGSDDPVAVLTDAQIALVVENYLASDRLLATATYPAYGGPVFFVDATADGAASSALSPSSVLSASAGWAGLPGLAVHGLPVAHSEMLDPATLELLGPLLAAALEH
jgi:thioesterase domain-containing protein